MISLLNPEMLSRPILDFGAGSCWITESIAKMGYEVTAFDIHTDLAGCIEGRVNADARIDPSLINYKTGDGHAMPFASDSFGHVLCYDTRITCTIMERCSPSSVVYFSPVAGPFSWNQARGIPTSLSAINIYFAGMA
jgi:2-polyprenyl-3-methyl-5-hydroxy-6-metoxy-1,4-benzoquinol methylase